MERYYSFPRFCKDTFQHKLFKVPLDAGFTCPNRDGTNGKRGCIFCSEGGSGDFAYPYHGQELEFDTIPYINHSLEARGNYIGYFQAYTNTYGTKEHLYFLYDSCLKQEEIRGISIGTRADCVGDDVIAVLKELKEKYPKKFIWVELGLQTKHEKTARWMRRGYPLEVFTDTVERLKAIGVPVIVHVILGLYGEGKKEVVETISYLNKLGVSGVKLQLLHVLENTDLATFYRNAKMDVLSYDEYIDLLVECIAHLDPSIVIHRLTGDGPKELLVAPTWSLNKRKVMNELNHRLKELNIVQGCKMDGEIWND